MAKNNNSSTLTLGLASLCFLLSNSVMANDFSSYQLGKWPLIANYYESGCLLIDDDRIAVFPNTIIDGLSINAKLTLFNTGGKIFVNPEITEHQNSLTFSLETANKRGEVAGHFCYVRVDLVIKAEVEKFNKLYVVIDKTVIYELDINNENG